MAKLVMVCGLMGVGKTRFAKQYAKESGMKYIDYDLEYHSRIQNLKGVNPKKNKIEFLRKIGKLLNNNPDKDFIIDNWFFWHKNWWGDDVDDTVSIIKLMTKRNVEIIFMKDTFKKILERYNEKHRENPELGLDGQYDKKIGRMFDNLQIKIKNSEADKISDI